MLAVYQGLLLKGLNAELDKNPYYIWVLCFPLYSLSLAKDVNKNVNAILTVCFLACGAPPTSAALQPHHHPLDAIDGFRMTHPSTGMELFYSPVLNQILFQLTQQLPQPSSS